ncbi:hypothetical protein OROHE_005520 [Orobanche hederae]
MIQSSHMEENPVAIVDQFEAPFSTFSDDEGHHYIRLKEKRTFMVYLAGPRDDSRGAGPSRRAHAGDDDPASTAAATGTADGQ